MIGVRSLAMRDKVGIGLSADQIDKVEAQFARRDAEIGNGHAVAQRNQRLVPV